MQLILDNILKTKCIEAFYQAFPPLQDVSISQWFELTPASHIQFGHYQCNAAMKLTKLLEKPPRIIAEEVKLHLEQLQYTNSFLFAKVDIAGPGFINLTVHPDFLIHCLKEMHTDPDLGIKKIKKPTKIIIDFSSPNVAKEMHVGHLRSTIIGDCLATLFSFLGYEVLRLNHIGDWGTQFGMLIAYLKKQYPDLKENPTLPLDLSELMRYYQLSKEMFDLDLHFKKESQEEVIKLQNGESLSLKLWEQICNISKNAYQKIYSLLEIDIIERGESFYNSFLKEIISDLKEKNLLVNSEGAECIYLEGFVNREGEKLPLLVQKTDGGFNYATTDLAALRHRVTKEQAHRIIYVTDAGQSLHFAMIFQAAKKAHYVTEETELDHVPFGLVLRPDGKKFKTREGKTEKLIDLLTTAVNHAKDILQERNPTTEIESIERMATVLGINAIKYADLSCNRIQNYVFSYEKMLRFEGNTAAFLLYAYVRIEGIKRKINTPFDNNVSFLLTEPSEISLALHICRFQTAIENTTRDLMPHRLTDYLFHLAEKFHAFFHQCRVEGSSQQNSRLILCDIVSRILKTGFLLLGLKTLDQM